MALENILKEMEAEAYLGITDAMDTIESATWMGYLEAVKKLERIFEGE